MHTVNVKILLKILFAIVVIFCFLSLYLSFLSESPNLPDNSVSALSSHSTVNSCEELPSILIVSARYKEDLTWLNTKVPFPLLVYQKTTHEKEYAAYPVFPNHGQEATAYLKYILENYDTGFPDVVLFLHGHETAWHVCEIDGNMATLIRAFRFTRFPFSNLKYTNYYSLPHNWTSHPELRSQNQAQFHVADHWDLFRGDSDEAVPGPLASHCCAQFAVSRSRLYSRPKEYYQKIYDFLMSGQMSDFWNSRMLEFAWAIIFREGTNAPYHYACELYHCKEHDASINNIDPEVGFESAISKKYRERKCKNWVRNKPKSSPDWVEPEYIGLELSKWSVPSDLYKLETTEAKPRTRKKQEVKIQNKQNIQQKNSQ
ncbi:hypothetical protein HK096_004398 [Nowakowskiella sp. JEL0078]|nr:hypothetical protein HK096_004398 [Nowakowskiella sp. JEL0078]